MNTSNSTNTEVTQASKEYCLEVLSEPRLTKILPIGPGESLPAYIDRRLLKYKKVSAGKYSLLLQVRDLGGGIYDIHIACPANSIRASRALSLIAVQWTFKEYESSLKVLTTNCPEGKIANMCRKLGATVLRAVSGQVYFITTPEQFNRKHIRSLS